MTAIQPLIIEAVPRMTPTRCGVSDFSLLIAGKLESAFGIHTTFVVLNSEERCDIPYPIVYCAPAQLLDACMSLSKGRPSALLVHLSGYGYSPDGAPAELADALTSVSASGRFRIAGFFMSCLHPECRGAPRFGIRGGKGRLFAALLWCATCS